MKKYYRFFALPVMGILGASALYLAVPQQAAAGEGTAPVTICFRGRTIQVPQYLESRYLAAGAIQGPCMMTPATP